MLSGVNMYGTDRVTGERWWHIGKGESFVKCVWQQVVLMEVVVVVVPSVCMCVLVQHVQLLELLVAWKHDDDHRLMIMLTWKGRDMNGQDVYYAYAHFTLCNGNSKVFMSLSSHIPRALYNFYEKSIKLHILPFITYGAWLNIQIPVRSGCFALCVDGYEEPTEKLKGRGWKKMMKNESV